MVYDPKNSPTYRQWNGGNPGRYLLTNHSLKECATLVQLSYGSVVNYIREPGFLDRLKALSAQAFAELDKQISLTKTAFSERVDELSMAALDRMETIIEKGGDNIAYKACQDILDRNMEIPRNRTVHAEVNQRVFDPAALIHAANVATELDMLGSRSEQGPTIIEGEQPSGD
jgi:hypothetical protein